MMTLDADAPGRPAPETGAVARPRPTREELEAWLAAQPVLQRPSRAFRLARFLFARSAQQRFLDSACVAPLLSLTPPSLRRALALRLLALSPHYFIYQFGAHYPAGTPRRDVLAREARRVAESRRALCAGLLRPYLRPEMTVLDFGSGTGSLAWELSRHVAQVLACDVSRGVSACARVLHPAANVRYLTNPPGGLRPLGDASVDFVVSLAVLQHLSTPEVLVFLREFARVLRPTGQALCHVVLCDPDEPRQWLNFEPRGRRMRGLRPRMRCFEPHELLATARLAGFEQARLFAVRERLASADDIGGEHVLELRRVKGATCS